jgi:hypothetical protein
MEPYSVAFAGHAGVDDAAEAELEHDVSRPETLLGRFQKVGAPQAGSDQRVVVVGEFEDRHRRATLWLPGTDASLIEGVNPFTSLTNSSSRPTSAAINARGYKGKDRDGDTRQNPASTGGRRLAQLADARRSRIAS